MLFHVYDDPKPDGYYLFEPEGIYRTILDADWLLYLLLPLLLILLIIGLMVAWHMHEIPKHKAEKKKMRQAELVSALTVLGLFEHWVWAVALFFAYFDWEALEDSLVGILRRSQLRDDTQRNVREEQPEAVPTEPESALRDDPVLTAPAGEPVVVVSPEAKT